MNKFERFEAVRTKKFPDYMPVWPRAMAQMIYGYGYMISDITGQDWYDSDKVTEAVLANIRQIDYDLAIPTYMDRGFGVPALGGEIDIPTKFGVAAGGKSADQPVKTKADWPQIKKKLSRFNARKTDPRMKGALDVIKNVSHELGKETPLVAAYTVPTSICMSLFRPNEAFLEDMIEDPEWVDEMCRLAADWSLDWVRAQYEAGANSISFVGDGIGTLMASPKMAERFNFPYLQRQVEAINKEFNQGVWYHIHGDMSNPKAYEYLKKLVTQVGIEGFHFDEMNSTDWIKKHVVDDLEVPACIITDGAKIVKGPVEMIRKEVKDKISKVGNGLGIMMAPSCQVLPSTPNAHFKAWVEATHEFGKYPLK